jgi:hypothetical protein
VREEPPYAARDGDATSDRQFAGGALSWSYGPYPTPVLARSHGMGDAFRRSYHRVDGALECDPLGGKATHLLVYAHLSADQGSSGDGIAAHAGDRSRNRAYPPTSRQREGRGTPLRSIRNAGVVQPVETGGRCLNSSGSVLVRSAGSEYLMRHSLERGVERLGRGKELPELALAGWRSVVFHRIASCAECLEAASKDAQPGLVRLCIEHEALDGSGVEAGLGTP